MAWHQHNKETLVHWRQLLLRLLPLLLQVLLVAAQRQVLTSQQQSKLLWLGPRRLLEEVAQA